MCGFGAAIGYARFYVQVLKEEQSNAKRKTQFHSEKGVKTGLAAINSKCFVSVFVRPLNPTTAEGRNCELKSQCVCLSYLIFMPAVVVCCISCCCHSCSASPFKVN